MKKIKLIFLSLLFTFSLLTLAGCSSDDKEKDDIEAKSPNQTFEIKVYDIDDELLGDKTLVSGSYSSLFEALTKNFDVVSKTTDYGNYITSINNSVVDSNYSIMIYENNTLASVGIDSLTIDAGDLFEFKVECWNTISSGYGTMDDYDVKVDKVFYHYAKTYMKEAISSATTYTDSNYWNYMINNLMISNCYDNNLFKTIENSALKSSVDGTDITTLSKANIGKYYYAAKSLGINLDTFKTWYQTYINNISTTYSDYETPFEISAAKSLNITSTNLEALVSNASNASTTWGPDALVWQVSSLAMFNKYSDNSVLSNFNYRNTEYGCTSLAIQLMAFAALNVSPRDSAYEVDSKDIIEVLLDDFYDDSLKLIKVTKTDTTTNYSTNQIYASLAAYKVSRDKGIKAYIFA